MTDELKPCPFCGGAVTVDLVSRPWQFDDYAVGCPKCYQRFCFARTEAESIKQFNSRPAEDALQAQVAALKDHIDKLANEKLAIGLDKMTLTVQNAKLRGELEAAQKALAEINSWRYDEGDEEDAGYWFIESELTPETLAALQARKE